MSATPGLKLKVRAPLERATLALTALALLLWVLAPAAAVWNLATGLAFSLAAVAHVLRLLQWRPAMTRHRPILWILHLSYAWIPLGLALLAAGPVRLDRRQRRRARAGHRRHRRSHHRHDHPHRARPHRARAAGVPARDRGLRAGDGRGRRARVAAAGRAAVVAAGPGGRRRGLGSGLCDLPLHLTPPGCSRPASTARTAEHHATHPRHSPLHLHLHNSDPHS